MFAQFVGDDGKAIFLNALNVTSVREINEGHCEVVCGEDSVNIPRPIEDVVRDLTVAWKRWR
jgi:hypothetical protein